MKRLRACAVAALLLAASAGSRAHDGPHAPEPAVEVSAGPASARAATLARPRPAADGSLAIAKPLQRLLGLRTAGLVAQAAPQPLPAAGEVQARPSAALQLAVPETGRVEAAEGGWPLPGRVVRRGERLAWLMPALDAREAGERRARIADLDQKLVIAELTLERLQVSRGVNADIGSQGNVLYEQTVADVAALKAERDLLTAVLEQRLPLLAPADGRISAVRATPGEQLAAGRVLLELDGAGAVQLVATVWEASVARQVVSARFEGGSTLPLAGMTPAADGRGWTLAFLPPQAAALPPGKVVDLQLDLAARAGPSLPDGACVLDASGHAQVWLHAAAERFVPLAVGDCAKPALARLPAAARLVVQGATRLSQY